MYSMMDDVLTVYSTCSLQLQVPAGTTVSQEVHYLVLKMMRVQCSMDRCDDRMYYLHTSTVGVKC